MAMFPCAYGLHRYRSAQQTIYPAVVCGPDATRRKLRLCEEHFDRYLAQLDERAHNAQMDSTEVVESTCLVCAKPVAESEYQFFATVYAHKADRVDYWAPLHELCASAAMEDWLLDLVTT